MINIDRPHCMYVHEHMYTANGERFQSAVCSVCCMHHVHTVTFSPVPTVSALHAPPPAAYRLTKLPRLFSRSVLFLSMRSCQLKAVSCMLGGVGRGRGERQGRGG